MFVVALYNILSVEHKRRYLKDIQLIFCLYNRVEEEKTKNNTLFCVP